MEFMVALAAPELVSTNDAGLLEPTDTLPKE
jgi:hypothetical protein